MIHWLIKILVPEFTFHAWVKSVKFIKVSGASCMNHQGSKEISKLLTSGYFFYVFNTHLRDTWIWEQCCPCRGGMKKSKAISNLNQTQNKKLPYSDIQELEAIRFYNSHSQNLKPEETIRSYRLSSCISQTIKSHPVIPALSQITCMWLKQDFQSCFGNINGESTTPQNFNWLFQWLIAPLPFIFSIQPQSV